jgi:hypothetical protein
VPNEVAMSKAGKGNTGKPKPKKSRVVVQGMDAECELCGFPFVHRHRIKPGIWGGEYTSLNTVYLCPNHHVAIHLVMRWFHKGRLPTEAQDRQLVFYMQDKALWAFWADTVRDVVIQRMREEGRWHPYVRTLPPEGKQ